MSKKDENNIRMAQTVHEVLNNNVSTWEKVKAFVKEVEESRDLMDQLKTAKAGAKKKSKGVTEDKANLQETVIVMGVDLARRACVYLRRNSIMEMYEQLNITKSELRLTADSNLVAKLQNIHKLLFSIMDKLADYNVTKENLETFGRAIIAFDEIIPKPRGVQLTVQRDNHTAAELLELIKTSFVNMDDLMSNFKGTDFAIEFENARKIIERGNRHNKPPEEEGQEDDGTDENKDGANE